MTRTRSVPAGLIAAGLICVGAVFFASALGLVPAGVGTLALLALAAAFLLGLMWRVDPAWLLSAGIVSTMFSEHWDQFGLGSTISPDRVLLGAALLGVLLRAPPARNRPPIQFTGVHFVLGSALVYVAISGIASGTLTTHNSQVLLLDQFGALPFLLFLVAPVVFVSERQRQILLGTLVATGVYLSFTALMEKLKIQALVLPSYITDPSVGIHYGRTRGPFVEAGAEGLALFACVVCSAMALSMWQRRWPRTAAAIVVVLGTGGILFTVTRGAWLASVVGTVVALVAITELRRFVVPILAAGAATVLLALALVPGLAMQVQQRQSDQGPIYERQNVDTAALRMVAARPFLGFGWERGNENLVPYFRTDPHIPLVGRHAGFHDVYLKYAVELGLFGLGLWLLGVGLAFGQAISRRAPPRLRPWQAGVCAISVAWLIIGLSSPASYQFVTVLLWTSAGIAYGRPREARASIADPTGALGRRREPARRTAVHEIYPPRQTPGGATT